MLPGVAISRQSGYFGKPVAGKNLWLVATMIVAIFGLRIVFYGQKDIKIEVFVSNGGSRLMKKMWLVQFIHVF